MPSPTNPLPHTHSPCPSLSSILPAPAGNEPISLGSAFPHHRPGWPLEIDLGCGKGRFLLARATARPRTLFLGVERMLKRLRIVNRKVLRSNLANVRLLRADAALVIETLLPPASVSAVHVLFPDPWPKRKHHRRRLFSPAFLDALCRVLTPDGVCHVATDHADYLNVISRLLSDDPRFLPIPPCMPPPEEYTNFEVLFRSIGRPIGRFSVRRT